DADRAGGDNIKSGNDRITKGPIGTLSFGPLAAQNENANDRKHVKDEHRKNDVVQKTTIEVSIRFNAGDGITLAGSRQDQQASPGTLQDQSDGRNAVLVEPG